jgi:hypothetical protein
MPQFWERHFLLYELILAAAIGIAVACWSEVLGGKATLDALLHSSRGTIYGTIASLAGALLGFLITTLTIVHAFVRDDAFSRLRASDQYPVLWRVFRWTIRGLALTAAAALVALLVDVDHAPMWGAFYLVVTLGLMTSALLMRSIWILERLLSVAVSETDRTG